MPEGQSMVLWMAGCNFFSWRLFWNLGIIKIHFSGSEIDIGTLFKYITQGHIHVKRWIYNLKSDLPDSKIWTNSLGIRKIKLKVFNSFSFGEISDVTKN